MNAIDRLGGALDRLMLPLVGLLIFVPSLTFLPHVVDNAHQAREMLIVCIGWLVITVAALAAALQGESFLSAGEGSWTRRCLMALALLVGTGSLFSLNPGVSLGHFWTLLTLGLVGMSVLSWLERLPEQRNALLRLIVVFAGLQGVLGITQLVHLPWTDWGIALLNINASGLGLTLRDLAAQTCIMLGAPSNLKFATGSLGNPNFLAEFLSLALPLGVAVIAVQMSKSLRLAWSVSVTLAAIVFLATGARGATLGVLTASIVAALSIWGLQTFDVRRVLAHRNGRFAAVAALVVLLAATPFAAGRIVEKFGHLGSDKSIEARMVNWGVAVELWKEHPIVGTGLGTYKLRNVEAMMTLHPNGAALEGWQARFIQAHSEPLQLLVEFGFVGFSLALASLGIWFWETRRNPTMTDVQKFGVMAGVGGLALAGCFGFPLHIPETAVALVLVIALGLARVSENRPILKLSWRPAYAMAMVGACLALASAIVTREVVPIQGAIQAEYAAQVLVNAHDFDGAEVVSSLAVREHRFKGQALTLEAQSLYQQNKYLELISLLDETQTEGLDFGLDYLKGWALHRLKRDAEARPLVEKVAIFCGQTTPMGHAANRLLDRMASENPSGKFGVQRR